MKKTLPLIVLVAILIIFTVNLDSQIVTIGQSSEWEATAFNNGRRVVRDCSSPLIGCFHYVWHSQADPNSAPSGGGCDIYYACTTETGVMIIPPTNLTHGMPFFDNRYPSIAIENDGIDNTGYWRTFNDIHLVWQSKESPGSAYEVWHARILVGNPPAPPASLFMPQNLSQTRDTDSLVPAVAINHYAPIPETNQHIHVVWQEEDVTGDPANAGSDIYYTRSVDSGLTFMGPVTMSPWDNITNTPENSQVPSISCCLDTFYGFPLDYYSGGDCDYSSNEVHVSYNEDMPSPSNGIHVFYLQSLNDGFTWLAPQDVTLGTGGGSETRDGYSNIAADMLDFVHIVFMRDVNRNEPTIAYLAGFNPSSANSFPGPDPGMYGVLPNTIHYFSNNPFANAFPQLQPDVDYEFPTVCLDRNMNLTTNWQEYQAPDPLVGDYEIMRRWMVNTLMPSRPLLVPVYNPWGGAKNESRDPENDDLFPNLAHKKVSMYMSACPGYTEVWTKVYGHGSAAAMAAFAKDIMMWSNVNRDPAVN